MASRRRVWMLVRCVVRIFWRACGRRDFGGLFEARDGFWIVQSDTVVRSGVSGGLVQVCRMYIERMACRWGAIVRLV